jgi:antitoxin YefM
MYSTYRLNSNELDSHFIEAVKKLFKDKEIEIVVYETDETEYLLKSEANRKRLLEAIENVNRNTNLVDYETKNITC